MLSIKYLENTIRALKSYKCKVKSKIALFRELEMPEKVQEWQEVYDTYAEMIESFRQMLEHQQNLAAHDFTRNDR